MNIEPPEFNSPRLALAWAWAASLIVLGLALHGHALNIVSFVWLNERAPAVAGWASSLSVLGLGGAAFVLFALVGLRRADVLALFLLTLLIGGLAVHGVKWFCDAARPAAFLSAQQVVVIGKALHAKSMPSGHSATWAAVALLGWFALQARAGAPARLALALSLTLVAALGALARVAVGAHWPADLLVGAGLGVGSAGLAMTRPGRRVVAALERVLTGHAGPWLIVPAVAATTWSIASSRADYPLAMGTSVLLVAFGCLATVSWMTRLRLHGITRIAFARRSRLAMRE